MCAGLGATAKTALLAELHARHFGVKDVDVQDGTVVVSVGNRFQAPYVDAIDRLVKRDVGDVPVRVVIDNHGDDPVASALRGIEYSYMNDGTKIPYLDVHQSREMTDRFRDMGVVQIASWPNDGTFIHVNHPTTKEQAEKILAAVLEHLPTDHVVVFSSARTRNRPINEDHPDVPLLGYFASDDVLAGNGAFLEHGGASSMPQNRRDPYKGLRDADLGR
jgi:hypothetical protein